MTLQTLEPLARMSRDIRKAAATIGRAEARYLVDTYYQMQHERITAASRIRATEESAEPNSALNWLRDNSEMMELQIKGALQKYAEANPVGLWAMSIKGVGPVMTAGYLSRLELHPTTGAWWKFCGLDPSVKWGKGEKRPWNAALKRLCWLQGESFVKVSGREDAFYGEVYRARKAREVALNEEGAFADQAKAMLESKNYRGDTVAKKHYEAGKLPPAHIHRRACRYTVKLFLSHLHHVWHEIETGEPPPKPYAISILNHAHYIAPPNWPMT